MVPLTNYFDRFFEEDTTLPEDSSAFVPLGRLLDATTQVVLQDFMRVLRSSREHEERVALLQEQPTIAGKFSPTKVLLKNDNAFEQMVALSDWLGRKRITTNHTFFLYTRRYGSAEQADYVDDYMPVRAHKFNGMDATMMHVELGATRGIHKGPRYIEWAKSDPWQNELQKIFIYSLEGLEMIRQPGYSAATVLKGNAFELDHIDAKWRYGSLYACVEDPRQFEKGHPKDTAKKKKSAGLNVCALTDTLSDVFDPTAEEIDICFPTRYEAYTDNGYADDLDLSVSPGELVKAANTAIVDQDSTELTRLIENLTIAKIGVPSTPALCEYIAKKMLSNDKENQ